MVERSNFDTRKMSEYSPDEVAAYQRGREAHDKGVLKQNNPERRKTLFAAWSRGWREAKEDKPAELPPPRRRMIFRKG